MRPLADLLQAPDPAWPSLAAALRQSRNQATIFSSKKTDDGEAALYALQVSAHSTLGAMALHTAGFLVDHAWMRVLGGAAVGSPLSFFTWNQRVTGETPLSGNQDLIIALDALGGSFAINAGGCSDEEIGGVFYLPPDTVVWESLGRGYTAFIEWVLNGDLGAYFGSLRWQGWEAEVENLGIDRGLNFYPPLFAEGPPLAVRSRRAVPMRELWELQQLFHQKRQDAQSGTRMGPGIPWRSGPVGTSG